MSRRRKAIKREVMPDPKFNDKIISKFTSIVNRCLIKNASQNGAPGRSGASYPVTCWDPRGHPNRPWTPFLDKVSLQTSISSKNDPNTPKKQKKK